MAELLDVWVVGLDEDDSGRATQFAIVATAEGEGHPPNAWLGYRMRRRGRTDGEVIGQLIAAHGTPPRGVARNPDCVMLLRAAGH